MLVISETACAMRIASRSPLFLQRDQAALELEVGNHRDDVRVARSLAVAVDAALHVRDARRHRGHRVRHRTTRVVVCVHAQLGAGAQGDLAHNPSHVVGQHAAVGVAQDERRRSPGLRREQRAHGVLGVKAVAVEEVLGIEDHAAPLASEERDGLLDHREVLVAGDAQGALRVADVALGDERDDGRLASRAARAPADPRRPWSPRGASCRTRRTARS